MPKANTLFLNLLETRALWIIAQKPLHGYAILKELNRNRKRKTTNGTLYPILQKLQRLKLVQLKSKGAREKKTYSITAKGRKTLGEACKELCIAFESIFQDFVCKSCSLKIKGRK